MSKDWYMAIGGQQVGPVTESEIVANIKNGSVDPTTLVFLAFHEDRPVGIATCFVGFSTFSARPVINIHDLHVAATHQRRGLGRRLLQAVEDKARALGCSKLTLEVQEHNRAALALYGRLGFGDGRYEPQAGRVLFREKRL